MNSKEKLTVIKNAAANVVRGGAAALVALVLPPFLTRLMSPDAYGVWSLVLQISMFVGYLDFGIQTAVGRFVAHANEKGDSGYRNRITSTAFAALTAAGGLAVAGILGVVALLPHIFRQMPGGFVGEARVALLLVSMSLALGLPASVFNGVCIGIQRYELPAMVIAGSRIVSALAVILTLHIGGGLISMAIVVAICNLLSYLIQYMIYRRVDGGIKISLHLVSSEACRELTAYCMSLTVWSLGMILVAGLDIALVGVFDFASVPYYSVAATVITFVLGLQNAIFGTLVPVAAVLEARDSTAELGLILVSATRYGMFLLFASGVPLLVAAGPILSTWVGPVYAVHTAPILRVLVVANVIRLSSVPYAMLLVGTGQQRLVVVSPLLEGFSNLLVSILAGYIWGAIGVAIGTLVGAIVAILCNFAYNLPRSNRIATSRVRYLKDGYFRPLVCISPFFVAHLLCQRLAIVGTVAEFRLMLLAAAITLIAIWKLGLSSLERNKALTWIGLGASARRG
jgi:O-antigen/teichoic acid export membrane protein